MSAPSPLPEGVRRDLERMAGPLAERMLPPRVTQSATTRNVVAAVNDDGTVDVMMGGAVMQHVPATTACVGVAVGDEVIVEQYGPRLYCVGVVAKSLVIAPYVISDFLSGFRAYSSYQAPTLHRQGGLVVMMGAFGRDAAPEKGYTLDMAVIPDGFRPSQRVTSLQQASQQYKHLVTINPDGYVSSSRYGTTDAAVQPMNNAWYNACCAWWTDDPMPD